MTAQRAGRKGRHHPLLLATAIEAAVKAGARQMARASTTVRVEKKGPIDLVTDVDVAIEAAFRASIAERFPDHAVLGEELGAGARETGINEDLTDDRRLSLDDCRYRWLFDPIDGTTNYAHGLPIFCASVALEIDGRIEVAAVYDPNRRELFTAERGGGAWLNGRSIHVSSAAVLVDAMLVTGFPYDVHSRIDEIVGLFARFVGRGRAVRRLGSAALDLCYVAAGRMDGFWEASLKPWDVAAGLLLVEEAGGCVTTYDGSAFSPYSDQIVASNGRIHDEMLEVIGEGREGGEGGGREERNRRNV